MAKSLGIGLAEGAIGLVGMIPDMRRLSVVKPLENLPKDRQRALGLSQVVPV